MKQKLIFLDIDGTLTIPGTQAPPESAVKAIRRAQALGHKLFLCTGRSRAMLSPFYGYGFEGAVSSAGGYVYTNEKVLFDCPMTTEQFETGARLLRENRVHFTAESRDITWYDDMPESLFEHAPDTHSELMRWKKAMSEQFWMHPFSEYDGSPVYKLVFMCNDEDQFRPARQAMEAEFRFIYEKVEALSMIFGEMINRKFSKGSGVRLIAQEYGADLADTIGFGDGMNDLEMMQTVGTSVCMENGNEDLKKISSMVCPAVTADGLYQAFETLGLLGNH